MLEFILVMIVMAVTHKCLLDAAFDDETIKDNDNDEYHPNSVHRI